MKIKLSIHVDETHFNDLHEEIKKIEVGISLKSAFNEAIENNFNPNQLYTVWGRKGKTIGSIRIEKKRNK